MEANVGHLQHLSIRIDSGVFVRKSSGTLRFLQPISDRPKLPTLVYAFQQLSRLSNRCRTISVGASCYRENVSGNARYWTFSVIRSLLFSSFLPFVATSFVRLFSELLSYLIFWLGDWNIIWHDKAIKQLRFATIHTTSIVVHGWAWFVVRSSVQIFGFFFLIPFRFVFVFVVWERWFGL